MKGIKVECLELFFYFIPEVPAPIGGAVAVYSELGWVVQVLNIVCPVKIEAGKIQIGACGGWLKHLAWQ